MSHSPPPRKPRSRLAHVLAAAALAAAGIAHAQADITWYVFNLPPQYIVDGPDQGQGFLDLALHRHVIPGLSGYRHKIVEAPFQRVELMLKTEPNACVMGLFKKPEREQYMAFSEPFLAQLPPGLLMRKADTERVAAYLDKRGKLSLAKLLEAGELRVAISGTRSYGAVIDELLKPYQGKRNLFVSNASNASKSLLQMALLGRVDVVPGFPYEAQYQGLLASKTEPGLRFYPLAEQPDYLVGHAACAKGEFGRAVIARVDALLKQHGVRDAMAGYYASWLDEESRRLEREQRGHAFAPPAARP